MNINEERMLEILRIAKELGWIVPSKREYPYMCLSEVEKCMVALYDDNYFNQMKVWDYERRRKQA